MKMLRLLILPALILTLFACKKEESPSSDPNTGSNARFKVTGVKDIDLSLSSNGVVNMPIDVVTNSGALPDTVSLQIEGLPSGVDVSIAPIAGKTSFASRIQFRNNNAPGGNYHVNIVAIGKSGTLTYPMILAVPGYIGWTFNDSSYNRRTVIKDAGKVSGYPYIYADATNGARLVINFPYKSELPKAPVSYKVGAAPAEGTIQLQFFQDSTQVFVSTAEGSPTASFLFDSLGKFIFKCGDVKMSNGLRTGTLRVSLPE